MMYVFLVGALLAQCVNAASLDKELLASGRIHGGDDALIETYPYTVSLATKGDHHCGGSIISANYVLTAAHCLHEEIPLSFYEIRSGSSIRNEGGTIHPLAEIIYHDDYNADYPLSYDIALVRVSRPFEFDEKRQPIDLFDSGEVLEDGTPGVVTGWGVTEIGSLARQLQVVTLPTVSKELCQKIYRSELEGQFCAGYYGVGGKDSCQSDSGGPLAVQGRLAGVVSYGSGCGLPEYPGVYVEVAHYRDWIKKHSGV